MRARQGSHRLDDQPDRQHCRSPTNFVEGEKSDHSDGQARGNVAVVENPPSKSLADLIYIESQELRRRVQSGQRSRHHNDSDERCRGPMIDDAQLPPLIVLAPAMLYVISTSEFTLGIVVFVVWSVLVSLSDAVLRPLFVGRGSDLPVPVILIGAIGGMILHGLIGLFVGAVVFSIGYRLMQVSMAKSQEEGAVGSPLAAAQISTTVSLQPGQGLTPFPQKCFLLRQAGEYPDPTRKRNRFLWCGRLGRTSSTTLASCGRDARTTKM